MFPNVAPFLRTVKITRITRSRHVWGLLGGQERTISALASWQDGWRIHRSPLVGSGSISVICVCVWEVKCWYKKKIVTRFKPIHFTIQWHVNQPTNKQPTLLVSFGKQSHQTPLQIPSIATHTRAEIKSHQPADCKHSNSQNKSSQQSCLHSRQHCAYLGSGEAEVSGFLVEWILWVLHASSMLLHHGEEIKQWLPVCIWTCVAYSWSDW